MGVLEVQPVSSRQDFKAFVHLPWKIYQDDSHWVPPLLVDQKKTLKKSYPFFEHGEGQLFLARKDREVVGRISVHYCHDHLHKHQDKAAFFGWFESMPDPEIAKALIREAEAWLKQQELTFDTLRGPFQWNINGENTGLLVEDKRPGSPLLLMPYNPAYYLSNLEDSGFSKAMDLYAYRMDAEPAVSQRLEKLNKAILKRTPALEVRPIDKKAGYKRDMEAVRKIFNQAWKDNWGATDISCAEMEVIAAGLKMIVHPAFTCLALFDGEPIGCIICVPDLSETLQKISGRLMPLGWLKLLQALKKVRGARTMLLGVQEAYRNKGIEIVLISQIFFPMHKMGVEYCELSWVLENNHAMNSLAKKLGAEHYRTYRIYEKSL